MNKNKNRTKKVVYFVFIGSAVLKEKQKGGGYTERGGGQSERRGFLGKEGVGFKEGGGRLKGKQRKSEG